MFGSRTEVLEIGLEGWKLGWNVGNWARVLKVGLEGLEMVLKCCSRNIRPGFINMYGHGCKCVFFL